MPPEEISFQTFFAAKLKDRGISIRKLSEATGIAPAHLESLAHGRFSDLPSAPYLRGYLVRLGKTLDFNGEEWWEKMKNERAMQNSGADDALPNNRFLRQSPVKFIWAGIVGVLIVIYLAFQIPAVFAGPRLTVTFPSQNPYTTASSAIVLQGIAQGANSLSLGSGLSNDDGGSASDTENITIASDGSWEKSVLLQDGPNSFQIVAKKLLGGQTEITEQIFYQDNGQNNGSGTLINGSSTATSTPGLSTSTSSSTPVTR